MDVSMLEQLQAIDLQLLTKVVRQDQRSPTFVISGWRVEHLSTKGIVNPDGLSLFHGIGRDAQGNRPWSFVLKILRKPPDEGNLRDIWYWKRELLAAQHGERYLSSPLFEGIVEGMTEEEIVLSHSTPSFQMSSL
jgi:hypothetical protein